MQFMKNLKKPSKNFFMENLGKHITRHRKTSNLHSFIWFCLQTGIRQKNHSAVPKTTWDVFSWWVAGKPLKAAGQWF